MLSRFRDHIVVNHPDQLSRQWAQRIVDRYATSAKVRTVDIRSVNIGTSTRLRLTVNHDAIGVVPSRWFVKTPSLAIKSRAITAIPRLLHKEVHFYNSLSQGVPVSVPQILAAESLLGRGTTLVMADLDELGFRPGLTADALSLEQAQQVVEKLAVFHAHYWGNAGLLKTHRWLNGFSHNVENHMGTLLAVPLMKRGLDRAGRLVPSKLHRSALRYAADRRRITRILATGVQTLVHHDCHPGNLFWNHSEPGFLDWQLVRMGEGVSDLAYFLATSLKPESRRAHEKQLLKLYMAALASQGISDLDEETYYQRYRAHLVYPFEAMIVTLAIGGMMERNSNLELIARVSAAVDDNDSYSALSI
ncbi:DUF1679 domain-containing protein [Methylomonas sp. LW13]|uniref:phosphotransferase n=1 Tax=Methylomonas sp. WH-1 TaxID=2815719 RepID=UPI00051B8D4E|nr:aminoglycoside phosphotransferase [Methylomonas sp. Kb3]QBC27930.1 DUF1679 domain-containing protein [Methylomonas sp. LW13]